jgi:hypothetical protein
MAWKGEGDCAVYEVSVLGGVEEGLAHRVHGNSVSEG